MAGQPFAVASTTRKPQPALEARRHQHTHARALALDQRVRAERRAVTNRVDRAEDTVGRLAGILGRAVHRFEKAYGQIVMCGERFGLDVTAVPLEEAVREGSADVDRETTHSRSPS